MITEKARERARILVFWEKHGLKATLDAFPVKRSTLYNWKKKWEEGGGNIEALNEKSRAPRTKRKRLWPAPVVEEIKRLREVHPNLGGEKILPLLQGFCAARGLPCPKSHAIGYLIHDLRRVTDLSEKDLSQWKGEEGEAPESLEKT